MNQSYAIGAFQEEWHCFLDCHNLSETIHEQRSKPLNTDESMQNVKWALSSIFIPCISILGMVGNFIIIVAIAKTRLRKSSHILLFSLALADFSFLFGVNNIPRVVYTFVQNNMFPYSNEVHVLLYVAYFTLFWISSVAVYSSNLLPVLLTLERLVAIFFPLTSPLLMTRGKVWAILVVIFLFSSVSVTYNLFIWQLEDKINACNTIGLIRPSRLYNVHFDPTMRRDIHQLTETVPVVLVLLGTAVIGIKIRATSVAGRKLNSFHVKDVINSKTTRTLLPMCAVYSLLRGFVCLRAHINQGTPNLEQVLQELDYLLLCINSSCNFLIYLAMNPKFKITTLCKSKSDKDAQEA